jgi:predicted dehydrogenase
MADKVGYAIVGAGIWGGMHARAVKQHPRANLMAICDLDKARADEFAKQHGIAAYTDLDEMLKLPGLQAVGVATPDHTHRGPVLAALNAGKHVLVEKPLATTVDDCKAMVKAAKDADKYLMVDFHSRWVPPFHAVWHTVSSGELGTPIHGIIRLSDTMFVPREMLNWAGKTTVLWFLGCHCVDLLRWIMNSEVVRVDARSSKKVLKERFGVDTPDYYFSLLEFDNGATIFMQNSWVLQDGEPVIFDYSVELYGTNASVRASGAQNQSVIMASPQKISYPDVFIAPEIFGRFVGGAVHSIEHFVDCVADGKRPAVTGEDGLRATQVLEAIEKSVAKRGPVDVG